MATASLVRPAAIGLISGLGAFGLGALGWLAGLDARAYEQALRMRRRPAAPNIAIVEIGDETIRTLGRWPWPWTRHARFLDVLREHYRPVAVKLGRSVDFGGRQVPVDRYGEMLVSYSMPSTGRPRDAFRRYHYEDTLTRGPPPEALEASIVLVGFGATGRGSTFSFALPKWHAARSRAVWVQADCGGT